MILTALTAITVVSDILRIQDMIRPYFGIVVPQYQNKDSYQKPIQSDCLRLTITQISVKFDITVKPKFSVC